MGHSEVSVIGLDDWAAKISIQAAHYGTSHGVGPDEQVSREWSERSRASWDS